MQIDPNIILQLELNNCDEHRVEACRLIFECVKRIKVATEPAPLGIEKVILSLSVRRLLLKIQIIDKCLTKFRCLAVSSHY